MKKLVYLFSILTFTTGLLLFACEDSQKEGADNNTDDAVIVKEPERDTNMNNAGDTTTSVVVKAQPEEWRAFKVETEEKIKANKERIAELRVKMKKPGKALDKMYANKIERLQERNEELRQRMVTYETNPSDWQKFKQEFNHDMDELGKALRDLTVDNK